MVGQLIQLLKDYSFVLKIVKLILACVSKKLLSQHEEYTIPRWLWIVYCIDSTTYTIIFFVLSIAHAFEKRRRDVDFTYYILGIILYCIGGIFGIIRALYVIPEDCETRQSELSIGIIFLCIVFLIISETIYEIYIENRRVHDNSEIENSDAP